MEKIQEKDLFICTWCTYGHKHSEENECNVSVESSVLSSQLQFNPKRLLKKKKKFSVYLRLAVNSLSFLRLLSAGIHWHAILYLAPKRFLERQLIVL